MSIRGIVAVTGLAGLMACSALVPPPPVPSAGHLRVEDNRQTQDIPPVVDKVPLLPRPEPAPDLEKYTVVVNEVSVKELLFALARDAQVNVDIDPGIEGIVTLNAIDQTLPQILDRIARQAVVRFEIQGKNIIVTPDRPYLRTYRVDYVNLTRESKGTIDVATQIATTGMGDIGGGGGGGGGSNNSTSSITNTANNRFWLTLTRNIQALVGETAAGSGAGQGDLPVTDSVIPNPESGIISVRATSKQHAAVQAFLDKVLANAQRQVLVEATVVEVTLNDQYQQGIDWRILQNDGEGFKFSQNLLGAASTVLSAGATEAIPNSFILNYVNKDADGKDINVVVQLLRTFGDIKVLSSPKIMTLNNQTAVLKVVENIVYFEVDVEPFVILAGGAGVEQQPTVDTTAKTVPVGLVMTVTPQINENDAVTLNVRPTISRVSKFVQDPNPVLDRTIPNEVPQIQVQEMESVLQINNGQIAVLGGLMQDTVRQDSNSIPLLSDIPVLGDSLFRSHNNVYEKSELVIFLRPLVIRNPSLEGDLAGYRSYLEERVESNTLY